MKKIIDGKRYNTETAELVAEWSNGYDCNDFKHCSEDLYRTPKGAWFIHGAGGAMSKYAQPCGDMTGGGSDITPLSAAVAREWLENKDFVDEMEAYFGDQIEDA